MRALPWIMMHHSFHGWCITGGSDEQAVMHHCLFWWTHCDALPGHGHVTLMCGITRSKWAVMHQGFGPVVMHHWFSWTSGALLCITTSRDAPPCRGPVMHHSFIRTSCHWCITGGSDERAVMHHCLFWWTHHDALPGRGRVTVMCGITIERSVY